MSDSLDQLLNAGATAAEQFAADSVAIQTAWQNGTLDDFVKGALDRERNKYAADSGASTETVE